MTIDGSKNCIYLHSKENRTEKWTRYDTNDKKKSYRLIQEDKKTSTQTSTRKQKFTDTGQENRFRNYVPERHSDCPDNKKPSSSCASLLGWQDVPHLARKMGREPSVLTLYYTPHQRELSCPNLTCEQSNQDKIMVWSNQLKGNGGRNGKKGRVGAPNRRKNRMKRYRGYVH